LRRRRQIRDKRGTPAAQACAFLAASTVPEVVRIACGAQWLQFDLPLFLIAYPYVAHCMGASRVKGS